MQIEARRIHPLIFGFFLASLYLWLPAKEWATDEGQIYFVSVLLIITALSFISLYLFPLKEKISLTEDHLVLDLKDHYFKIQLSSIKNISFHDTKNELLLTTDFSEATFDISHFRKSDIDKLSSEKTIANKLLEMDAA